MELLGFIFVVGIVVVLAFFALTIKSVPQGQQWVVLWFGRYTRTLNPGLNVILPVAETIGKKVNVKEQFIDLPKQSVITKDNAIVQVDGVLFYQITHAPHSVYNVQDLVASLTLLKRTNLRSVIGSMELDQVLSHRDEINVRLREIIGRESQPWGVAITRVEIRDILPPEHMTEIMEKQMGAERQRRVEISLAEGQKQGVILKAEGDRQATFLRAEAREREAQAEAAATRTVNDAITAGGQKAVSYFLGQEYLKMLAALAQSPNQKVLILPMELTGTLGSIASITELMRLSAATTVAQRLEAAE